MAGEPASPETEKPSVSMMKTFQKKELDMLGNFIALAGAECVRVLLLALRKHLKRKLSIVGKVALAKSGAVIWRALRGR